MENRPLGKFITNNNKFVSTVAVTMISVVASLVITALVLFLTDSEIEIVGVIAAVAAPLLIAPPITWYIVGLLLRIHELEKEQRRLASIDHLTQLFNRRHFLQLSTTLLEACRAEKAGFAVAMLDLDKFKSINDTFGHEAGDEVLKSVAKIMNQRSNENIILGRLGGEEFAICFGRQSTNVVKTFLDELRLELANQETIYKSDVIEYTASIGLAFDSPGSDSDLSKLLASADTALYEAKSNGRNRLEMAS